MTEDRLNPRDDDSQKETAQAHEEIAAQDAADAPAEAPEHDPVPDLPAEMDGTADDDGSVEVPAPLSTSDPGGLEVANDERKKKRWRLVVVLLALLALLLCVSGLFIRYLLRPEALPRLLPMPLGAEFQPHYLFSIYGLDRPLGVAVSPDGKQIYVTETGGERLVKIFDREGEALGAFSPPRIEPGQRSPVYVATDAQGRVFVTDRLQHAIFVYGPEGTYVDTILGPDLTLGEYIAENTNTKSLGTFAYNRFESLAVFSGPEGTVQTLPAPEASDWAPLGMDVDSDGNLWLTDVVPERHAVREIRARDLSRLPGTGFDPRERAFGATGQDMDEFLFPNATARDSSGRIFVTDGNNSRVSAWNSRGKFLFSFGQGAGDGALNLPRGAAIDEQDWLYVADAVGQAIRVYEVSGTEPGYLFSFGEWGMGDGQFNYPNDIALDASGRLYIADRENNRIQVWSY